jgi:hypothetical protein
LDVIVANAGITSNHAAEDYTLEEFHEVIDINFNGAYYTASAAARIFKKQGFGNVIFTASISATLVNFPQQQAAVCIFSSHCSRIFQLFPRVVMRALTQYLQSSIMHLRRLLSNSQGRSPSNGLTSVE